MKPDDLPTRRIRFVHVCGRCGDSFSREVELEAHQDDADCQPSSNFILRAMGEARDDQLGCYPDQGLPPL